MWLQLQSPLFNITKIFKFRRSTESSEIAFKRKISEGPSAFIRMTSAEEHEIDTGKNLLIIICMISE